VELAVSALVATTRPQKLAGIGLIKCAIIFYVKNEQI